MSESSAEMRKVVREEFWRVGNVVGWFVLAGICASDCFVWIFVVPKFAQIFMDALPGKPLPLATLMFIGHHFLFALVALAWPIVGAVLLRKRNYYASYWIIGGIVLFILLAGLTIIAMFMPMIGLVNGMADASK